MITNLLIILLLYLPLLAQNGYIIIVNKSVKDEVFNRADIESIFLGKKTRWSNGIKTVPVTMKEGEIHELFIRDVIRKSISAYMNYWRKMIFTGKGVMPVSFETDAEILEYVNNTPGAISYLSATAKIDNYRDVVVVRFTEQP
jgi:ABC-type phosphate transport system substrate-binding protein